MTDLEYFNELQQEAKNTLAFAKWREEQRIGTHNDKCWSYGPRHYECAVREVDRLNKIIDKFREILT